MATTRQTWEYVMEDVSRQERLNELGAEGWELAGNLGIQPSSHILKRPALTFQEQVTLDQRKRYFGTWGIDIDEIDRESIG